MAVGLIGVARWCRAIELGGHFRDGEVERAEPVGEACADRKLAAIDRGVRASHGLDGQAAIGGNQGAELGIEPLNIGLDR